MREAEVGLNMATAPKKMPISTARLTIKPMARARAHWMVLKAKINIEPMEPQTLPSGEVLVK